MEGLGQAGELFADLAELIVLPPWGADDRWTICRERWKQVKQGLKGKGFKG